MSANEKQVAGSHYRSSIQHWDYVVANDLDYFQAHITKYVTRWKNKNGFQDLEKAKHFLEKYMELHTVKSEIGVPDHLKEFVPTDRQKEVAAKFEDLREKHANAISPMMQRILEDKEWNVDTSEPMPQGYVNQDGN